MKPATSLLTMVVLLAGCAGGKGAASGDPPPSASGKVNGTVTLAHVAEGCPVLIALEPPEPEGFLMPVGLEERFVKEGLALRFTYTLSRIQSGGCAKGTPAVLGDITLR